ncbi:cigA, partial [Symbiodinium necroappetens]
MVRDGGRFTGGLVAAGAAAWERSLPEGFCSRAAFSLPSRKSKSRRKAKFAAHHAGFAGLENGRRELCLERREVPDQKDETAEKEHPKWKDRLSKLVVRFVKTPAFGPDSLGRSCEKFSGDFLEFLCIDDHVSVQILKRAAALTLLLMLCTAEIARYRRPALCILDQCFRDAAQQPPDVIARLSQRTRNELLMVAIVGPLLQTDLRTGWCPEVFCMDASPTGAGLCTAPVPENAVAELHRYSEQRGFYTKLEAPSSAALREMGEEVRAFLLGYPAAFTRQLAAGSLAAKGTLPYTLGGGLYNGILHVYSGQNRQLMTPAWQIDKKWQFAEPGESRPVISVPIVQAVTSLGLVWKWSRFVGVVLIGFLCMLHPSEYLMLTRGDLILPSDVLSRDRVAYVAVQMTRFCVIEALFGHLPFDCRLYPGSKNTFRSQWNAVMQRLEIPFKQADKRVTPGVLRGSGVTHLYLETEGLVKVARRGRWARQKTVEFYLQEVAAQVVLQRLPAQSRARIAGLAEFSARLVEAYACSAMRSKHLEGELRRSIDRRFQYQGEGSEGDVRRSTARAAESLRPGEGELRQSIARRSQYQGRGDEGDVGHQICQVMYVVRFPASRKARGELRQSIARRSQHQGPDSEGDVRRSIARKSESSRPDEGELRQSIARRSQYQGRGDEGELRQSIARRSQHQGPDSEGDVRRSIARKSESSRPDEGELRQSIARRSQYQGRGDEGELRQSIARRSQHQGPDSEGDVRRSIARKSESSRPDEGELRQSIARRSQYQGRGDEGELRQSIARRSQYQGPDSEGDVRRSVARKSESSRPDQGDVRCSIGRKSESSRPDEGDVHASMARHSQLHAGHAHRASRHGDEGSATGFSPSARKSDYGMGDA